jgi:hypothetical protein
VAIAMRHGPAGDLPREFALAAACAIWPRSERRVDSVRRAAAGVSDWDRFVRVVMRQRVQGLAYDGIVSARVEPPPRILETLRAEAQFVARQNLAMTAEAIRLRGSLAEAGLPVAFLKGATLAIIAYGSLGLRHSKDIDALVPADCVFAAAEILVRHGYVRLAPAPSFDGRKLQLWLKHFNHFTFYHREKRIEVGLHWRLSDNPLLSAVPAPDSWREVAVTSTASLPTLAHPDLFSYLCIHGAYHAWFRLKWVADIGALLAAAPKNGADHLLSDAENRGPARPVAQAALLADRLLGAPLSPHSDSRRTPVARCLATMALAAMTRGNGEREPPDLLFGSTLIRLSEYLLDGWRFKLAQLGHDLVSVEDWRSVPLPDRYAFFYPLLRLPLWAWRRMVARGRARRRA